MWLTGKIIDFLYEALAELDGTIGCPRWLDHDWDNRLEPLIEKWGIDYTWCDNVATYHLSDDGLFADYKKRFAFISDMGEDLVESVIDESINPNAEEKLMKYIAYKDYDREYLCELLEMDIWERRNELIRKEKLLLKRLHEWKPDDYPINEEEWSYDPNEGWCYKCGVLLQQDLMWRLDKIKELFLSAYGAMFIKLTDEKQVNETSLSLEEPDILKRPEIRAEFDKAIQIGLLEDYHTLKASKMYLACFCWGICRQYDKGTKAKSGKHKGGFAADWTHFAFIKDAKGKSIDLKLNWQNAKNKNYIPQKLKGFTFWESLCKELDISE